MKITLTIIAIIICFQLCSQDAQTDSLRELYKTDKLNELVDIGKSRKDLNAKSLYYVAMAHYKKGDDNTALIFFDQAISKGPFDHDMFYYKGKTLTFLRKYDQAMFNIDKAIELLPGEPDFLAGKGDIFFEINQKDSAFHYYEKAVAIPECAPNIVMRLADVYLSDNNQPKALELFKRALSKLTSGSEDHQTCLYNIGLIQQITGAERESVETFENLIKTYPKDYHGIVKLIQAYNSVEAYEKVKPLKESLYEAHNKKILTGELNDRFCFDQFKWKDKKIMAFENFYEDEKSYLIVKHQFFVVNDSGKIEYQVRSESSPAVRMSGKNNKYVLCLVKDGSFSTFWNYIFNDESAYADTKKAVIKILEGKSK